MGACGVSEDLSQQWSPFFRASMRILSLRHSTDADLHELRHLFSLFCRRQEEFFVRELNTKRLSFSSPAASRRFHTLVREPCPLFSIYHGEYGRHCKAGYALGSPPLRKSPTASDSPRKCERTGAVYPDLFGPVGIAPIEPQAHPHKLGSPLTRRHIRSQEWFMELTSQAERCHLDSTTASVYFGKIRLATGFWLMASAQMPERQTKGSTSTFFDSKTDGAAPGPLLARALCFLEHGDTGWVSCQQYCAQVYLQTYLAADASSYLYKLIPITSVGQIIETSAHDTRYYFYSKII